MGKPTKNILVVAAVIAALFIPTYIAIINFIGAQYAPVSEKSVTRLEITDPSGIVYTLTPDKASDAQDISAFVTLNNRSLEQPSLPEPLRDADYFEFKYYSYDRTQIYKYYFTANANEAYYVDSHGTPYHVSDADAQAFLATKYARSLYTTSSFPTLSVSGAAVTPTSGDWAYLIHGTGGDSGVEGKYAVLDDIVVREPSENIYQMVGAFALNFDHQPDYCHVTVSDNGNVVYSDSLENVVNATLEGKAIDVYVEAKWYEGDESSFGSATYQFKAKILMPAVFYLGETEIDPGEFVVISAKNVDDPTAIKFVSEPDIGFTPTFFEDGKFVRALVPVPMDFEGSEVKFTCTYGEVSQDMTLDIADKTFGNSPLEISATVAMQTRTDTTIRVFEEAMAPIVAVTEAIPLWEGTFLEGPESGILRVGFGRYCTISGTGETYRHQGVDYLSSAGKTAQAINNGKVVYVGYLELPGYMVVVDHGLGLKSWYCHLSDPMVKVGDTVNKGDVVGMVGSTGFTSTVTLHMGLSVYDVPVCPYDLWEKGVTMTQ